MINPILIIASVTVFLSALVVALLNKPQFPLVAASSILILIFFIITTIFIDMAITDPYSEGLRSFMSFLILGEQHSTEELESVFSRFKYIDIGLLVTSIVVMFIEALVILRKNSDKK